jgi:hypothetical protein
MKLMDEHGMLLVIFSGLWIMQLNFADIQYLPYEKAIHSYPPVFYFNH